MIETIQRFASAFVSGDLDSFRTHFVLLVGSVGGEIAVAAGIILESPKEKGFREWLGLVLVFGGVVVSASFTISLLMFDEGISAAQRDKIIVLETKLAPRVLTVEQTVQLTAAAKPFAGTSFTFRTETTQESVDLLLQIAASLRAADWKWIPSPDKISVTTSTGDPAVGLTIGRGVIFEISDSKLPEWRSALMAIATVFCSPSVPCFIKPIPTGPTDAIRIVIGGKL